MNCASRLWSYTLGVVAALLFSPLTSWGSGLVNGCENVSLLMLGGQDLFLEHCTAEDMCR